MITGQIVYDPELRFTPSGKALLNFDLETLDGTVHCVAWESVAEDIAEDDDFFHSPNVILDGYFKSREWVNRDGEKVTRKEYTIKSIRLAD